MREIKFRLVKDGKVVGYEKHAISCGVVAIFHSVKNDDEDGWEWWNVSIKDSWSHFIDHDHKDQFIGILGMGKKEIYERDILRVGEFWEGDATEPDSWADESIQKVVFGGIDYPAFHMVPGLDDECNDFSSAVAQGTDMQVIGNVHENPKMVTP